LLKDSIFPQANSQAKRIYVGIFGSHTCDHNTAKLAESAGEHIARMGAVLICGGMGGVMESACCGAKRAGGTTIGILPGINANEGNQFLDYRIVTGMGDARNLIIVHSIDAAIAISGSYGTLSEISFCLKNGVPVISLGSWQIPGIHLVTDDPEQAVQRALAKAIQ